MSVLYVDMDNVVANFEGHYLALTGVPWDSEPEPLKRWEKLAGMEKSFFMSMPAYDGGTDFIEDVMRIGRNAGHQCKFLTAVPSLWSFPDAMDEKTQWVIEKLNSKLPVVFGPHARNKAGHCMPGDILIDDSELNIQQWNDAGGIGILHTSFLDSISHLRRLLIDAGEPVGQEIIETNQQAYDIPSDFPHCPRIGALPGAQPKMLLSSFQGRYYPLGCTPPELFKRWEYCEDLAQQFSQKSLNSKMGKRAHMSEEAILQQYYERLLKTGWAHDEEIAWLIRRAAKILAWPSPI